MPTEFRAKRGNEKWREQMEEFASDTEIIASVTRAVPHLHPFTLARVFGVTRELATARLKTMQERGLVEKMKNGQYKILRAG